MKETRIKFNVLLSEQRNQVRTLLAFAGGDPREEITEVVFLSKPFDRELLRSLPSVPTVDVGGDCPDTKRGAGSVLRTHEPGQTFREDFAGLPPLAPRVRRDLCDPDGEQ